HGRFPRAARHSRSLPTPCLSATGRPRHWPHCSMSSPTPGPRRGSAATPTRQPDSFSLPWMIERLLPDPTTDRREGRRAMETKPRVLPNARTEMLTTQELADEVLVYDMQRHRAHSLNRTAALVWRHCDGNTPVAEIAQRVQQELGTSVTDEAI